MRLQLEELQLRDVRDEPDGATSRPSASLSCAGSFIKCQTVFEPHLLQVDMNGEMSNLDNFVSFPDYPSTAKVMGGKSAVIPDKITT